MGIEAWLSESISNQEQKLRGLITRHSQCMARSGTAESVFRNHRVRVERAEARVSSLKGIMLRRREIVDQAKALGYTPPESKRSPGSIEHNEDEWLDQAVVRETANLKKLLQESLSYEADVERSRLEATGIEGEIEIAKSTLRSLVDLKSRLSGIQADLNAVGHLQSMQMKPQGDHAQDKKYDDWYDWILIELRKQRPSRGSNWWKDIPEWTR